MPATIPSLWPDDIKVDTVAPVTILRIQAEKIQGLTNGVLAAEVTTLTGTDDFVIHRLELVAPSFQNRRYGVLSVTHRTNFYPLVLEADCFRPRSQLANRIAPATTTFAHPDVVDWPPTDDWRPVASDQDEFIGKLSEVLRSKEVRAFIDSMIALSNE